MPEAAAAPDVAEPNLSTPPNGFVQQQQPTWPPRATVRRPSRSWLGFTVGTAVGAALIGTIWLVTAHSGSNTSANTFELKGTMTLSDDNLGKRYSDSSCYGTRGYSDISEGAAVTVYGANNTVIATGSLGKGVSASSRTVCTFSISVPNVPGNEKFYQVEVSHRGKLTIQADEAKSIGVAASPGN